MATTAGGIAPSTAASGDGIPLQGHLVGAGPPRNVGGEHQQPFMSPAGTVRPHPRPSGAAGLPLLTRLPLGSPPSSGPSPLFPPQAEVARPPPQAGGQPMPGFPLPSVPPADTPIGTMMGPPSSFPRPPPPVSGLAPALPPPSVSGGPLFPPSSPQQPPPSQQPPNFPPRLPPPISGGPLPQFPPPGSAAPTSTSGPPQLSTNAPQPYIRPPGPPMQPPQIPPPQFRPPTATGLPLAAPVPGLPPQGGVSPQHRLPPPNTFFPPLSQSQQTPPREQIAAPGGSVQMPPPSQFSPVTMQPPNANSPHHQVPTSSTPPPISAQTLPPTQHTTTVSPSTKEAPPLLPSPQMVMGDPVKGAGSEAGVRDWERKEAWYEHKMPDGRVYFSHSVTRKTTWDRPQNVQVLPHPAQQQQQQQNSNNPTAAGTAPPTSPLPSFPHSASHLVPTRVWSEFKTPEGKPYFYNKITRVSIWEMPKDFDLVMPLPPELGSPTLPQKADHPSHHQPMPHPAQSSPTAAPRPPLMSTPLMFPPGRPPFNPGFPPGHPGMNLGLPPPHVASPHYPPPLSGGDGGSVGPDAAASSSGDGVMESNGDTREGEPEVMEVNNNDSAGEKTDSTTIKADPETDKPAAFQSSDSQTAVPEQAPPVKEEPKGPRPIASVPISGTPWSVVWTSDERQFFFDVTSRVSLWIMPEELKDNPGLEKILEDGPPDGKSKSGEPSAKKMKLGEGGGEGVEEEEEEEEMEEGAVGLDIPTGMVAAVPAQTEVIDTEKKAAMMRSGKTVEERQEEFKEMLLERGVSAFSTWDKELPKFVFDPRYMLLNSKERKSCFDEFIRSRAEEERKEKRSKLKARRDEFRRLLEDCKLHPKSSFSEFAQRNAKDERFKAVEKMREREQLFSEYLQELKKSGASSASSARNRGERTDSGGATNSSAKTKHDMVKADFLAMLSEDRSLAEGSQWRKVKGGLERDPRYRAVPGGSSQREEWFKEYVKSLAAASSKADQSREERIQASLKEREREVQMSRLAQEKEWGRERDQLRKTEAVQQFKSMLADTIRNTGVSWNDARRQLRQESRWASTGLLEAEEKEKLFQEHCDGLAEKKRLQFRRLLEETTQISLDMPWKKAKKLIREDPRYKNFTESDHRREAEYDKHLRDKMLAAKNEFRSLLRETKIINYKSHKLVEESGKHYKEIIKVLENDKRYLVLECVAEEREMILQDFMKDLHFRGPPPPPTATNPSERLRKP